MLQIFDFQIEYRKGSDNIVADTLSRSVEEVECSPGEIIGFKTTEFESEEYKELKDTIMGNREKFPDLKIEKGLIFKKLGNESDLVEEFKWKLWIPSSLTNELIRLAHEPMDKAHGGIRKTLEFLRENFNWPNMIVQVKNFVNDCTKCKECKSVNVRLAPGIGNEVIMDRPFQKLYIDFLGK